MNGPSILYDFAPSPVGDLLLTSDGGALTGLYLESHKGGPVVGDGWERDEAPFRAAIAQLDGYFEGGRRAFDLPILLRGTGFQKSVWEALRAIPFGETVSYARLAARVGVPKAVRAVGAAVGRNPTSIIVPCHRVVGSGGALTGYAGGIDRKRWLLENEGQGSWIISGPRGRGAAARG